MNYDKSRFPSWGGIVLLAVSAAMWACGETSNNPKGSASDGSSGSTDTGTTVTTGTGGTGAATVSAVTTNGTTTNGSTTGGMEPVVTCYTSEQVQEAAERLPGGVAGAGGEGGVPGAWQCPEYFPHPLGPPCGGIRFPDAESDEDTCCYTEQICN